MENKISTSDKLSKHHRSILDTIAESRLYKLSPIIATIALSAVVAIGVSRADHYENNNEQPTKPDSTNSVILNK
ncbi:hypothetical protein H6794_02010 [Candidatus Nomurabacteria bacterium]|jgi:hypothetical protein|nr:hypothetical protein [Candidatus Nomurabacteria bacterium]